MRILAILLSTLFIFIIRGEVSHAINVKLDDRLQLVGNQNGKIIVGFKPEAEHRTQPKPFQWQQLFGLVPQASHTQTHKSSLKPEPDPTPTPNGNGGPTVTGTAALPQSVTDVAPVIGPVIEPTVPVTNVMPIPTVDISPVAEPVIQPTVQATNVMPTPKTDVIGTVIQTPVKGSNRAPMTGNGRPTTPENDVSPLVGPVIQPTVTGTAALPQPVADVAPVIGPAIQTPVQVTNQTPMTGNGRPTTPLTDTLPASGPVIKPTVAGTAELPQPVADVSAVIRPEVQPTLQGTNVIPMPKTDVSQVIGAVIQTPVKGSDRAPMIGNGRPTTPKTDSLPASGPVIPPTNVMPIPAADISPVAEPVIQPTVQATNVMPMPETGVPQVIGAPVVEPVIQPTVLETNVMPIPAADVSPVAGPVIPPTVQGSNVMPLPEAVIQTPVQVTDRTPNADRMLMTGNDQTLTMGNSRPLMIGNDRPTKAGTDVSSVIGPLIQTPVQENVLTPIMKNGEPTMSGTDGNGIRPVLPSTILGTNSMPMTEPVIQPTIPITNGMLPPVIEVSPVRGPVIQPTVQGTDRTPMTGNFRPTMPGTVELPRLESVIQPTVPVTNILPGNNRPIMPETGGMTMGGLALQPQPRSRLSQLLRLQQVLRLQQQLQPKPEPKLQLLPGADEIQMPGPVIQTPVQVTDRNPMFGADRMLITGKDRPMTGTVESPVIGPVIQPVTNVMTIPANDRPIMPETEAMTIGGLSSQPQPQSRLQQLLELQQLLQAKQEPSLQLLPEPVIQPTVPVANVMPQPAADISPVIGPVIQPTVPVTNIIPGNDLSIMPNTEGMTMNELSLQPQPQSRLQQLLELQQLLQPKPEPSLQLLPEPAIQPTVPVTNLIPGNDRPIMPNTEGMTMGGLSLQPQPLSRLQQLLGLQQLLQPKSEPKLQLLPEPVIQPTPPIANVMPQPAADISPVIGPVIQPTVPVTNVMPKTGNDGMTMNRLALQPQPRSRLQQLLGLQQLLQPKSEPKLQLLPEPVIQPTPPIANVMPQPAADISPVIGPVIQPTVPVTNVMPKTGNDGMTMNRLALQPQPRSRLQQLLGLQQILRLQQQLQPKPEPKLQLSPAVLLSSILKSASQSESNAVSQPKSSLNLQSIIKPQFSLGPKFPVSMQPKINDNANFGINPIQTSMVNPLLPTVLQVLKQLSQLICNGVGRNEILSGNSALNGGLSVLCDENLWSAPAFTSQANRVISLLQNRLPKFGVKI
ncbi:MAGE-like protein 2 isoform X2 [Tetranychus urticae]|uniref:MAGE-like protein 2 isoform X2 n=1 Tax=Tetranychus urticae TaxID=32264 RepID=UPI00077BFA69|nr:MAGE-like protein 2 isoform X2 [Tetranychus urticae]